MDGGLEGDIGASEGYGVGALDGYIQNKLRMLLFLRNILILAQMS